MFDVDKLTRKEGLIPSMVAEIDGSLIAKKRCYIVLPFRWIKCGLLTLGRANYCAAIFPLVNENGEYSVCNFCTQLEITPSSIEIIQINGVDHYAFVFDVGATITPDTRLVMDDAYSYLIYDEIIQKAKAPWFLNYDDVGRVMATSKSHSGITLAADNIIFEIIVATLSRDETLRTQYRERIPDLSLASFEKVPFNQVPIVSVVYAATNKMTKIMGGYIDDGMTSALTEDESPESGVVELLRKQ